MLPQLRITFEHLPLPDGKIRFPDANPPPEFPWYAVTSKFDLEMYLVTKKIIADKIAAKGGGETEVPDSPAKVLSRQLKWICSNCRTAYNAYQHLARFLSPLLDVNAPVSNAFTKMIELCYEPVVSAKLRSYAESGRPLRIICLAEAPGTFPIAIMYWLANKYPRYVEARSFEYHCTSLEPPATPSGADEEPLGDTYDLISADPKKWTFMDHTSASDTRRMYDKLGKQKCPFVTGDIELSPSRWEASESELFRIDLGQFIGACTLLEDNGMAVLKGFAPGGKSSLGILRLAMGFFDSVIIHKPRSSRMNNNEVYLILIGFKVDRFEPRCEELLQLMDGAAAIAAAVATTAAVSTTAPTAIKISDTTTVPASKTASTDTTKTVPAAKADGIEDDYPPYAYYPSFLPEAAFTKQLSDQFYRYIMSSMYRRIHTDKLAKTCLEANIDYKGDPYEMQKGLIRSLRPVTQPYVTEWLRQFPVSRMGKLFYDLTGISNRPRQYVLAKKDLASAH